MICSRCNKSIDFREEVRIESSTICRDCFQAIVARCHTCHRSIYKNELIYEISPGWGAGNIFSASQSEKIIQCDWCYQKWLIEKEKEKKWWRERKWVLGVCSVSLLFITFLFLWLTLVEKWKKISCWRWYWIAIFVILSLSFAILITVMTYLMISAEFISRYKERKRKGENNKKKKRK